METKTIKQLAKEILGRQNVPVDATYHADIVQLCELVLQLRREGCATCGETNLINKPELL